MAANDRTTSGRVTSEVGLVGHGTLHEVVRRKLAQDCYVLPLGVNDLSNGEVRCSVVLSVSDGWDPQLHDAINRYSIEQNYPWLRAYVEPGRAVVGPCVVPRQSGCVACAETRRRSIRDEDADYFGLLDSFKDEIASPRNSWLTKLGAEILANLLADEVANVVGQRDQPRTRNAMIYLELDGLRTSVHRFLPDPLCPLCGELPEDSAEAAQVAASSRLKAAPTSYRVRSLSDEKDRLANLYVDSQSGVVSDLNKYGSNIFPSAVAPAGLRHGYGTEIGFGRKLDYESSELTAVTEALERYGGIRPGGKKTIVTASHDELGESALDPTLLGLPSEDLYERPGYPFVPYRQDLKISWVWGYSFRSCRPILVPESYAYYGAFYGPIKDRPFVYETSNGCALGGCLEEAILYGMLEVAERDAFLMTWYARLRAPIIDPLSARDHSPALMVERVESLTGYAVRIFDITLEQGIPCFWAMAIDEHDRTGKPKALCSAGAHLNPEKALINALLELAPQIGRMSSYYQENRKRAMEMIEDPYKVLTMEDHSLLYCAPEVFERLTFLTDSTEQRPFEDRFESYYTRPKHRDLLQDLNEALASYHNGGLDVIVVDQTTPEHAAGGFSCVKVIIPGTLPMTFGHHARRTEGLERLRQVPHELGYYPRALADADINPYPHPFP